MPPPTKSDIALLVVMVSVVGGGVFPHVLSRFRPIAPPPSLCLSTKLGVGVWFDGHVAFPPFSSPGVFSLLSQPQHYSQIYNSFSALWSSARNSPLCCSLVKHLGSAATTAGCAASLLFGDVDFDGFSVVCRKLTWMVLVWVFWFGGVLGVKEIKMKVILTRIVGGLGFSPELVPIVYCFTGVGSSFSVLFVEWATGVGSGWAISLLLVSTGLLYGLSRWCHVIVIVKCLRSSVEIGSSSMPKGVVEFGVSLMPRGVTCAGPSGIIIVLTCVSGLSSRGFNPCRALRLDVLILLLYVTIVSVIVSLTLITYHIFIVDLF